MLHCSDCNVCCLALLCLLHNSVSTCLVETANECKGKKQNVEVVMILLNFSLFVPQNFDGDDIFVFCPGEIRPLTDVMVQNHQKKRK